MITDLQSVKNVLASPGVTDVALTAVFMNGYFALKQKTRLSKVKRKRRK